MEITKAVGQISKIILGKKAFLGTMTAKNKDSFQSSVFHPAAQIRSLPGPQPNKSLSFLSPSGTTISSCRADSY